MRSSARSGVFALTIVMVAALGGVSIANAGQTNQFASVSTDVDGQLTANGLVTPLDNEGKNFYLRNEDGLIEVRLTDDAIVGLLFRVKKVREQYERRKIVIEEQEQTFSFRLPQDLYVKVRFADWEQAQKALTANIIQGGKVYSVPLEDHLPTKDELYLSGRMLGLAASGKPCPDKTVAVSDRIFTVSTQGYNHADQVLGLFDHRDIQPFINQASVYGYMDDGVFYAREVALRKIPDQLSQDDPNLKRYMVIGDSISGNYDEGLREALVGKLNVHHPPTNCGPSAKGASRVNIWLGDYTLPGHQWDVLSFNFGHWDTGKTKAEYQSNLESIVRQLEATGAKLIWVTTCPVPNGYEPAGELVEGKAPGRKAGVIKKYLNPWALEVIQRHPRISICNQWQLVQDNEGGIYTEWWKGQNVHFSDEMADRLGRFLANHVEKVMSKLHNDHA